MQSETVNAKRRWLVLGGVGVLLSGSLLAGDKVKFSDSNTATPVLPESARRGTRSLPFSGLLDKESSLGGVSSIPFSAYHTPTKSLTPKERELLDRRNNWLQRTPESLTLDDKSTHEAFGVREYSLERDEPKAKGELEKLAQDLEGPNKEGGDKKDVMSDGPEKDKPAPAGTDPLTARPTATEPRTGPQPPAMAREVMARELGARADSEGSASRLEDPGRELLRNPFSQANVRGFFGSSALAERFEKQQRDRAENFKRILGADPVKDSLPKPLEGALESINLHPDLTRQDLNPVFGSRADPLGGGTRLSVSDSLRPVTTPPPLGRAGAFDPLSARSLATAPLVPVTPSLAPPKRQPFTPLILEAPKRGF